VEFRPLGRSGLEVTALSLGSWRTFERISREQGLAVMAAARDAGIAFLDDARYNDETGSAPIPTGYSEVVFGDLYRATGWKRDEVVVANKLWWEFWPRESAAEELEGSLGRMGFDYLDVVYAERPPEGLSVAEVVTACAELIASGKVRAWGVLNWRPELVGAAVRFAEVEKLPPPCAAQLPYGPAYPEHVEDDLMTAALDAAGACVVASAVLAGGALSGKYASSAANGRLSTVLDDPRRERAFRLGAELVELAAGLETTPSRLALAFALANPRVASVLFGATTPEQVAENAGALDLARDLEAAWLPRVRALAST
jgi:aryl-alcohol dehydrogenase-like predicted oxidoreductase